MRENQKIENQFNLALGLSNEQRKKTADLDVGYNPVLREWEMIVKYSGDISYIAEEMGIQVVPLLSGYAIVRVPEEREEEVANLPEVEYVEKPKSLYFALETGRRLSCVDVLQMGEIGGVGALNGEGVMVDIIDSGIDNRHPDFRNDDGSTRILRLWDQTIMGSPPKGFYMGSEFTSEDINEALNLGIEGRNIVPSVDLSGHGTHVASIAAGNGRASNGVNRGVAPSATLVVVKLGNVMEGGFPRTTQLMTAMDYVVRLALELNMPYVINLSFGNNYGDHQGVSLLETYMDDISNMGRGIIVVGTGNEGNKRRHKSGNLLGQEEAIIEIGIEEGEGTLNLQIWKEYPDEFQIQLIHPSGEISPIFVKNNGVWQFQLGNTNIAVYYGEPTPYNPLQEIYIEWIPLGATIDSGVWKLLFLPIDIISGRYELYLPVSEKTNSATGFLRSNESGTLTIPSTASKVIAVGAYDAITNQIAPFSGRGFQNSNIRPDLVAPGVDIIAASPGGFYTARSGTSMATPFVSGAAALLMEWGIIRNQDPYLYGEKVKSYLTKGARKLNPNLLHPNEIYGWGALCVASSIPS